MNNSNLEKSQLQFDHFKCPCSIKEAETHAKAKKMGIIQNIQQNEGKNSLFSTKFYIQ